MKFRTLSESESEIFTEIFSKRGKCSFCDTEDSNIIEIIVVPMWGVENDRFVLKQCSMGLACYECCRRRVQKAIKG